MCVEDKWHASLNMLTVYVVFSKDETTKNFKCVWLHACTNNEVRACVLTGIQGRSHICDQKKRPFAGIDIASSLSEIIRKCYILN